MGKRKRSRSRDSLKRRSRRDLEKELCYLKKKFEKENRGYVRRCSSSNRQSRTRKRPRSRSPTRFHSRNHSRLRSRSPINKLHSRSSSILHSRSPRNGANRYHSRSINECTDSRNTSRSPQLYSQSRSPIPSTSRYESSSHNTSNSDSEIESMSNQTEVLNENDKRNQGSSMDSETVVLTVEREILEALGETQSDATDNFELHSLIQKRWEAVLTSGLIKEEKEPLINKYSVPSNLDRLRAPELNAEIKSAISINNQKTDKYIQNNQNHLGTGLSALGRALSRLVNINNHELEGKEFQNELIKALSDAGKIFCNVYYNMSICRRSLILPLLHVKVKEITASAPLNKFLFGDNLSELLKTAKAIERSGEDLRNHKSSFKKPIEYRNNRPSHLNFQGQSKLRGGLRQGRLQPQKKGTKMNLRGNHSSSQRKN